MPLEPTQPPLPVYIFRGQTSQIHALHFYHQPTTSSTTPPSSSVLTLASGDAAGYVSLWSLVTKRPLAVWKAHDASILAIHSSSPDRIITHGRDSKITIWRVNATDLDELPKTLPSDDAGPVDTRRPCIERTIPVGTVNFCGVDVLPSDRPGSCTIGSTSAQDGFVSLLTLPSVEDGQAEARELIPSPRDVQVGMVMAIKLFRREGTLRVMVGYESGHVAVWARRAAAGPWTTTYMRKAHAQPVLAVDVAGTRGVGFSSAADGILARHPLAETGEMEARQTRHAGQQGLVVRRDDESIFATAGWDGRVRVYDTGPGMKELAVLKWHKEGCYATAFADVRNGGAGSQTLVKRELTVAQKRAAAANSTHWLAAGSKDGKISLWDIY